MAESMLYLWRKKLFHFIGATTSQDSSNKTKATRHIWKRGGGGELYHTEYYQRTSFVFSFHNHRLPRVSLLETETWSTDYGLKKIVFKKYIQTLPVN